MGSKFAQLFFAALTAALAGWFAVQHDELMGRGGASDLFLDWEDNFFQSLVIDVFQPAAKDRLARSGIAFGLLAHTPKARRWAWLMPLANLVKSICPRGAQHRWAYTQMATNVQSG